MATALNIKRKNIDLPVDILQKLSIMAAARGQELKELHRDGSYIKSQYRGR